MSDEKIKAIIEELDIAFKITNGAITGAINRESRVDELKARAKYATLKFAIEICEKQLEKIE